LQITFLDIIFNIRIVPAAYDDVSANRFVTPAHCRALRTAPSLDDLPKTALLTSNTQRDETNSPEPHTFCCNNSAPAAAVAAARPLSAAAAQAQ
jgi:hypothetical protein